MSPRCATWSLKAVPLAWQVRQGATGHLPEDLHMTLVKQVHKLIPPGASVVLLGDGECDAMGFVCSTRDNRLAGPLSAARGVT